MFQRGTVHELSRYYKYCVVCLKFHSRPPEQSPKIAKPTVFHVVIAGYWGKFSISNNRASVGPHRLRYCHCAKLIVRNDLKDFKSALICRTCGCAEFNLTTCQDPRSSLRFIIPFRICSGNDCNNFRYETKFSCTIQ